MKVYPFKIPKPVDAYLIVQIDKEPIFYNRLHQHEEIQISHIINGSGKLLVGDSIHQFGKGDTYVIGSNLPHIFKSVKEESDAHMLSVFFTESTFGSDFFNLPYFKEITPFFQRANTGFKVASNKKKIARSLLKLAQKDKLNQFIGFLKILHVLSNTNIEALSKFTYAKALSTNEGQRLQVVFDFVFKNFHKPIALEEVSKMAYMTPTAFCRFFKQRTNKTFFEFLIELRIEHACQLLRIKKEMNINLISDLSGFNSISNFNKKFKKVKGTPPTQYQQLG